MMKKFLFLLIMCAMSMVALAQTKSIQCDFVQTKTMKMLGEKMVSKGKMYYQHSDKLHWEYTTPYQYTFIMNGSKVLLKKGARKDVIDTSKNKIFKEIGKIMLNSVVVTGNKTRELPLSKEMKGLYTKILLYFNSKTTLVEKVVMYEKNGDTTEIQLQNVQTNKPVSAAVFAVQ